MPFEYLFAALPVAGFAVAIVQFFALLETPAKRTLPEWRGKTEDFLIFLAVAIFCLLGVGFICTGAARAMFPQIDLQKNILLLVPATQTIALAFLLCAVKIFPKAFPQNFDAPQNLRAENWLSTKNPFGVPAFFVLGVFAVSAASLLVQIALQLFPQNVRDIFQTEQILVEAWRDMDSPLVAALCVPAIAVFTPILEEIIFRAGLYRFLAAKISPVPAAISSGVIFALMHDSPASYLPLAIFGSLLCFVYEKTGRLAAPILVHALFNANTLLLVTFSVK